MESPTVVTRDNSELRNLQLLVEAARARLAEVETSLGVDVRKVDALRAKLFSKLRLHYERRERLRLLVQYRKRFIEKFAQAGKAQADEVSEEFQQADADSKREYESTAAALGKKRELSTAEESELKAVWKQLVKLFHPDKFFEDAEKRDSHEKLTQAINHAKDTGDIETLREIAGDPERFMQAQGWMPVDLTCGQTLGELRNILEMLQLKIAEVVNATDELRTSSDYELYELAQRNESILESVTEKQRADIEAECAWLSGEAESLKTQIGKLTGAPAFGEPV